MYQPLSLTDEQLFTTIADHLRRDGYSIVHGMLPATLTEALQQRVQSLQQQAFSQAGTGRQNDHQLDRSVRRDKIRWLNGEDPAEQRWLDYMSRLQQHMNRHLFLGLFSYECHFAHYRPGDFYRKHMDAFRGQANRVLSTVLYLNADWDPEAGGELVLYQDDNHDLELTRVIPSSGTLVTFLSEEFPHQVLPASNDRYSIAGWFRLNTSTAERIDPPR